MVPEAHVLQNSQIDETRRPHPVAVRIGRAVANNVESQLPFWGFDAAVSFARFGSEPAQLRLWINDRALGDVVQGLLKNLQGLPHLQDADHVAVVNVTVLSQWHAEVEPV